MARPSIFTLCSVGWIAVLVFSSAQPSAFEKGAVPQAEKGVRHLFPRKKVPYSFFPVLLAQAPGTETLTDPAASPRAVLDKYCVTCHNERLRTAGLALDTLDVSNPGAHAETWEKVVAKLEQGSMPPPGRPRPEAATYRAVASALEGALDRASAANPNPGRIGAVHRLNRAEYNNAIRDLLALDVDVKPLLPGDETADGSFDNFAGSLSISTTHLERYMSVARQVTRVAVGLPPASPTLERFEIPLHVIQDDRQDEDLPLGSRGGMAIQDRKSVV